MPKRLVSQTVVIYRDGNRVVPKVGQPFDFTKEELDNITKLNPDAVTKIISQDETNETQTDSISNADHRALLEQARKDAVEQFKREQAGAINQGGADAQIGTANTGAGAGDDAAGGKNDGSKKGTGKSDKKADDKSVAGDDDI